MSDHNQCCDTFDNFENEIFENESVKESDELLIDAVRAYPHLYNHKDPNFKNHLMKKNSWKEITLTVNIPVSECQIGKIPWVRWVRFRERFGKEKRQRELDLKNGNGISQRTVPASSSMTSLKNSHLSLIGPPRHFSNVPHNLHKSDDSTRNSIFSMCESTSSPAATIFQTTPSSRRPSFKKKNNSVELESSLILHCELYINVFWIIIIPK
ncbi:Transcription factor Adf-1 [Vespula maculifrons]|uniref:Transcription factor Adf-1 n=1 Tax=Vespula maculifrons TaxID=7453 RepID=A0ABD2CRC9_VESMC